MSAGRLRSASGGERGTSAPPVRVLIAEDKLAFRRAMSELIGGEEQLELVGAGADAQEAIDMAARLRPDVALLDVRMPEGGGARATREILTAIRRAGEGKGTLSAEVTADVIDELSSQLERQDRKSEAAKRRYERIRRVIEGQGPNVVFQPIFDLVTVEMVGMEALARFSPDFHGPPNVWFSVAATVGLLEPLEIAAVQSAVGRLGDVHGGAWMSVNVSPGTAASPRFLEAVTPLARRIVLEITEHAPVHDYDGLNEALREFRAAGGRLAIDDAGAGFASLRHILRLNPDFIKLDGALTRGIDLDRTRRALGAALISFASEIGVPIIAEAVETQGEVDALRSLGVTLGQGFFLGLPSPLPVGAGADGA